MPEAVTLGELLIDFVSVERDISLADLPDFTGAAVLYLWRSEDPDPHCPNCATADAVEWWRLRGQ